ncbi:uncharacterized protein LOC110731086 [Chenopodium quinoa]|uniref:DUF6598 domain-containing protein n=1 Tax=Chenopodium quinoa TaxID=63459 RepID=A0A803NEI9_CHEQI|nr:uncharacterized protein LOC110685489 [Chenopodium quinoa]XP_021717714.1 uncharacterized protein LOC110685490 [Chenopodium quinoa]XP_021741684.1 uncharacterized protein LOC110707912 [Chenopodium quinoa]XP_021741685.1 uncharacterized protein LOC110707915 [Chenopodium quinoa]XP_021741686.1 uncharacterized protein LOC110707917 [Chenopodium quinoa]XP_021741687.1 uncharacterized protein LOC110707918 [Chenopodium quinoa]XP_021741688.1 uncharacterized protein LOC110707919 [Chenopodium quinoa]XP_0
MASTQEYAATKVMFSNNVQATLSVKLINGDGEDPAQVYGSITGRFGISNQFSLFNRPQSQRIDVRPGEFIPLSQPSVNVPEAADAMEITAYLMDYDTLSPDDEIANGTVTFLVRGPGVEEKQPINGKYGSIEVNVTWG